MFICLPAKYPIDEFICSSNELVVAASLVVSRCKKLYPKSCQKGLRSISMVLLFGMVAVLMRMIQFNLLYYAI